MAEQAKITSLNGIIIGEGCVFSSDNFKNSSENVITLPSTSGTLALAADVNAQKERIDRLLNYLEKWINVGNLTMSDIKTSVNASS